MLSPQNAREATASPPDAHAVVQSAADAIVCCDAAATITAFNPAAERLYGHRPGDILDQPLDRLFDAAERDRAAVELVLAGEEVRPYDTRHRHADDRRVDVSVSVSPIVALDGSPAGASLVVRRIECRVAVAAELARTRKILEARAAELVRSNEDLEQFAYIASHDLSEPLRTITGMLALLRDECGGALGEDADDYIRRAVGGADRLRTLIDDLLVYSRVGRSTSARCEVDLEEVVDEVVDALGSAIGSSHADVSRVSPLPTLCADPGELRQVLQNLVSNSLKFNDSASPTVEIAARRDADAWRISVADDGIGIAPQYAERVFGPFKRLHTRDAYAGTGIGLAICRRIVERRGGRIWLEHRTPGTKVSFTIPDAVPGEAGAS